MVSPPPPKPDDAKYPMGRLSINEPMGVVSTVDRPPTGRLLVLVVALVVAVVVTLGERWYAEG